MQSPYGLFLGLTTLDLQYRLPHYPLPNSKHKVADTLISMGGPAANAAATFAHLGGKASFCTVVGQHALTDFFVQEFTQYQLHAIDLSPESPHLPTLASVWTSADNGDRTIVTNVRQESPLELARIPLQPVPEIILLDGFHMEAALHLARLGRERGVTVVLDGGSWKEGMDELLRWVDIAICSADFRVPGGQDVFRYLAERGVAAAAISRGGEAILGYEGDGRDVWARLIAPIPVPQVPVIDTLGAGDVLHGAFCWFYARERSFAAALKQAAAVASRSCAFVGAKGWFL